VPDQKAVSSANGQSEVSMRCKRAITDKEKTAILKRLELLWLAHPSLRLGQLIGNVYYYPSGIDPYFDQDYDFMDNLEEYYGKSDS
jgi:hypothetical protein